MASPVCDFTPWACHHLTWQRQQEQGGGAKAQELGFQAVSPFCHFPSHVQGPWPSEVSRMPAMALSAQLRTWQASCSAGPATRKHPPTWLWPVAVVEAAWATVGLLLPVSPGGVGSSAPAVRLLLHKTCLDPPPLADSAISCWGAGAPPKHSLLSPNLVVFAWQPWDQRGGGGHCCCCFCLSGVKKWRSPGHF